MGTGVSWRPLATNCSASGYGVADLTSAQSGAERNEPPLYDLLLWFDQRGDAALVQVPQLCHAVAPCA